MAQREGEGDKVWKEDRDEAHEDKERGGGADDLPSREEKGERALSSSWSRRGPMRSAIRNEGSAESLN